MESDGADGFPASMTCHRSRPLVRRDGELVLAKGWGRPRQRELGAIGGWNRMCVRLVRIHPAPVRAAPRRGAARCGSPPEGARRTRGASFLCVIKDCGPRTKTCSPSTWEGSASRSTLPQRTTRSRSSTRPTRRWSTWKRASISPRTPSAVPSTFRRWPRLLRPRTAPLLALNRSRRLQPPAGRAVATALSRRP